jgi:O-antigen/teichoic acid export membrane protein
VKAAAWLKWPAAGFVRDTAVLAAGLAVSQLLMLAVLPLWSRLYAPADFAAWALWSALVSVVSMLLLLRYDTSIVIAKDDAQARALLRLCIGLAVAGGTLLALLAWALPASWLHAVGLAPLGPWVAPAVVAAALAAVLAAGQAWANRQGQYARITASRLTLAVVTVVVGTLLGLQQIGGGLLIAALLAGVSALATLAWRLAPHSGMRAAAQAHRNAPRFLWPAAMLDAVTQQIPLWLTALWFTADLAGQFGLAWRVLALPLLMLASAAGSVFYQRFAQAIRNHDRPQAARLLKGTWRWLALIGMLPALAVLLGGAPLFSWAFGARWAQAGQIAALLAPMLWAMLVSSPTSGALIVLGLQKWAPVFGVAMLVYRPAAFWIGASQGSLWMALGLWVMCEIVAIVLYNLLVWRRLHDATAPRAASGP